MLLNSLDAYFNRPTIKSGTKQLIGEATQMVKWSISKNFYRDFHVSEICYVQK